MKAAFLRAITLILTLFLCIGLVACDAEGEGEPGEDEITGPVELSVKWNFGYVASSTHATSPNQIVEGGDKYSYTDVFTVKKAGTTITFTDDNSNSGSDYRYASDAAYVVSSWKQEDQAWVLDTDRANYAGDTSEQSPIVVSCSADALTYSYTTFEDNENLRLCFRSGQRADFTPEAFPKVIAEHTGNEGTAAEEILLNRWINDSKADYYEPKLEGLTVNALGDSYFAGSGLPAHQIWLNLWAKKYGMTMNNYGIGGSTVACGGHEPMCIRYTNMKNNDPDIVLLEGGRNDYNGQIPIGEAGSSDTSTYIGAWNTLIDGVQAKYPEAMIVVISPWNFPYEGKKLERDDYINAMCKVAQEQGVYFIDASIKRQTGVDMESSLFREEYCKNSNDVSHLNAEGMKLVMPYFDKQIATYYNDFLAKK